MPTGYTAYIQDGSITEFKDFAIKCARAFGACITMRDDSMDAEIPEKFESDHYYENALNKANEDLIRWQKYSRGAKLKLFDKYIVSTLSIETKAIEEKMLHKDRYEKMLQKVRKWNPPSSDHIEFKNFMISQIEDSIKWDCDTKYNQERIDKANTISFEEWCKIELDNIKWNIEYYSANLTKEKENLDSRNKWISQLRKSLQSP